jgi:tetratricopeptide (TPR) repeat protein
MRLRILTMLLTAFAVSACANPLNERTAHRYYDAGERAFATGNLPLAKENFSRALINARLGHMGPKAEVQVLKQLGRTLGNMCEQDEAEKAFLAALAIEEKENGDNLVPTFPTKLELAQFSFDTGRFEKATDYFARAFAAAGKILEEKDPISIAVLLDDYAKALSRTGNTAGASDARARAQALRAANPAMKSRVVKTGSDYVPYPKSCK